MNDEVVFFLGVDWGDSEHQAALTDAAGEIIAERRFEHSAEGLAAAAGWALEKSGAPSADHVRVAIETPHGPVVDAFLERGFRVFAINPKQIDRFRDRFSPSGAKDDRRDARVGASALRTDPASFRRVEPLDPVLVELREWSRLATTLGRDRVALVNRLREQLWRVFPALIELDDDPGADWLLDLLEGAPTPAAAARLRPSAIAKILRDRRIRRLDADAVIAALRGPRLMLREGTQEAARAHFVTLVPQIRLLNEQVRGAERRIVQLTRALGESLDASAPEAEPGQAREQNDVAILSSLPGVGRIILAVLLAEGWDDFKRRDYAALRSLAGVAPVTKQSGRMKIVMQRRACHPRLADAMRYWADAARRLDPLVAARYKDLRAKGHNHSRTLRSIADRLLNVACAMLRDRTLFRRAENG